jgi:hypothetical protein
MGGKLTKAPSAKSSRLVMTAPYFLQIFSKGFLLFYAQFVRGFQTFLMKGGEQTVV